MNHFKWAIRGQGLPLTLRTDRASKRVRLTQKSVLNFILNLQKNTLFGRAFDFKKISKPWDYQKAVPIMDFEAHRPWVDKIIAGEEGVLTSEKIVYFNMTNGTEGKPKWIPMTQRALNQDSLVMRQWLYRLLRDHPKFLDGFLLGIVSPAEEGETPLQIPYGSASGRIYRDIPPLIQKIYTIPYPVFEISDYQTRSYLIALYALNGSLSFMGTANPMTLLRLFETIQDNSESLLRDIYDGTLLGNSPSQFKTHYRAQLKWDKNPGRSQSLQIAFSKPKSFQTGDLLPELKVLSCWMGGSVGSQIPLLDKFLSKGLAIRDLGLLDKL